MNSATIKINSYKNQNTILLDGKPIQINSELMNYYSKPIVSVAGKILSTLEAEFNDNFSIEVFGNLFEQSLFASLSKKNSDSFCRDCLGHDSAINISTQERLKLVDEYLMDKTEISLSLITDNRSLSLPDYEKISYVDSSDSKLIVSSNTEFIGEKVGSKDVVIAVDCGAEVMKQFKKNTVILCSSDNVQAVVNSYVDTCFVNALISKTVDDNKLDHDADKGISCLTEPLYYAVDKLDIDSGESIDLPIKSIPMDADKSKLSVVIKGTTVKADGTKITGDGNGESEISLFVDCPIPFATISAFAHSYNYVKKITIDIDADSDVLCSDKEYDARIILEPVNAQDLDSLVVEITDPDVAEYKDGKLYVKKAGEFGISAKTTEANALISLISKPKIESIRLSDAPKNIYIGDAFEVLVTTSPENAYNSKYKWVTSNSKVAVVGVDKDSKEMIKAKGVGHATITCVSVDNESISATMEVYSDSTFNRKGNKQTFLFFGILASIISMIIALIGGGTALWVAASIAAVTLIISIIRNEGTLKAGIFLAITVFAIIYSLFLR